MLALTTAMLAPLTANIAIRQERGFVSFVSVYVCVSCVVCIKSLLCVPLLTLLTALQKAQKRHRIAPLAASPCSRPIPAGLLISNPQVEAFHMGRIGTPAEICATCVPPSQRDTLDRKLRNNLFAVT
jgi:hypothetical protein